MKGLNNKKGFISIMALLIMGIILISSSFLVYTSKMEYLIINSNKNNLQSYYLSEGKIYKLLYQNEYYYNEILPRIKTYLKYGYLGEYYSNRIRMDENDLIKGDTHKIVYTSFLEEDNRKIMTFKTNSIVNGSTKEIFAKVNIIKDFYELGIPLLYSNVFDKERRQEYIEYINYIQKEIGINQLDNDIMGIESLDYDNIIISEDLSGRKYFEFYRNLIEYPVKHEYLNKDKFFLLIKGPTNLLIESKGNNDKLILNGVIYTEGNIEINSNLDLRGILILNQGDIYISSDSKFKLEGIILSRAYPFKNLDHEEVIEINYNDNHIKINGIYLPGYIEPKIKVLRCK